MGCKAEAEINALEKSLFRQQIINCILAGIIFALNIIWLCIYLRSQQTFEYIVEETTETEVETIIEQDGRGENLAVIGDNNVVGGSDCGSENYEKNNNKEENNS